jgi:hypothetical protein
MEIVPKGSPNLRDTLIGALPDTEQNTAFELIGSAVPVIRTADGGYALPVNRHTYPRKPR